MATTIHDPARDPARAPGVPPTVKGLSLVSLFNDFASEMVYPLLPAFVTRTLGGGAMVGDRKWAVIGPVLAVIGVALGIWALRRRARSS